MGKPYLSVVIPSYNEKTNIGRGTLDDVYAYLTEQEYEFELLLVDDGSTDGTPKLLEEWSHGKPGVKAMAEPHRGKGPTVRAGMLAALGENRLYTDFDQSTPLAEVEKLLPFRHKGYEVIFGSREVKGSRRENEPWYRHVMGKVFNLVVQIFTVRGIHDTQCGFKLFSERATELLFPKLKVTVHPQTDPFTGAFDVELLYLANKYQVPMAEVPVLWAHHESKRVNPVKDSIRMFGEVVKIKLADVTGAYGKAR
jgi:dolichyl-phosphate beta-glucosyltransferase